MTPPWTGLSLMPEDAFRLAAAPLFAAAEVEALEWSFDLGWDRAPDLWLTSLLAHYGEAGRLFGHGVHYSPLSAVWEVRQARWLSMLAAELETRSFVHVSEHYGFMTAPPFVRGSPLPAPRCAALLKVGHDRLRRLRERLSCPLGIENLALAWNRDEALAHGAFLNLLLERPDDFVVLDVHNLYCQAMNFGLAPDTLLASFPLQRVREIHVSGGSWLKAWPDVSQLVRCDTHDERVPAQVFDLLRAALTVCPNVRVVIFERLGATIRSELEAEQFRADFRQVREIVTQAASAAPTGRDLQAPAGVRPRLDATTLTDEDEHALASFQSALLSLLSRDDLDEAGLRQRLAQDRPFARFRAEIDAFDSKALGIASRVVKKWCRRAAPHDISRPPG